MSEARRSVSARETLIGLDELKRPLDLLLT